jgi:hypothetical protein
MGVAEDKSEKSAAEGFFNNKKFYVKLGFLIGFLILVVIVWSKFKKDNA